MMPWLSGNPFSYFSQHLVRRAGVVEPIKSCRINSSMSKEALVVLNRKRGALKAQLKRIKDFMNNPDEKDKTQNPNWIP
ncbi:hypothetical protein TNCV_699731 [Trichonephila clavipes]|nr:hypothetical protein TNCV_699731 [Trichonephila clavipes]